MQKEILKDLLKEYENKRILAERKADKKKEQIYISFPQLSEIDKELNNYAIQTAKILLSSNPSVNLTEFSNCINELKKKKKNILSSLNIKEEDLKPIYSCKKCNDTGYYMQDGISTMCSCLKQSLFNALYNKSNIGNLETENFEHFNLSIYSDEIDSNQYQSTLSPKENMKVIHNIGLNFVNSFAKQEEKDLLFTGNPGLGKTFLSNCIAKEVMSQGRTVLYQTAPILLDSIIDYKLNKRNISNNFYETILDVDLLIIDDLGTESLNSMKFTELFNIINTRILNKNKKISKTIISTNLSLQDIFRTYDERIVSRLVGYYNICKFYGKDIRFNKK